eukprot:CAMPEP_0177210696 /NCGR_PEP_ID=MMETSP0367-20130122/31687_1 /TAXON_ID=447022 ORGANISM="Scrippsiella hangoei-like, Strain SHHI-4" /NCGR_SAMPLE_ID=MMETSP0367 /ASSEMBLY_ACC=CAM_ASM_000362 /LENGTH=206 /DNA_ID=CAMNT_0018659813 /DNA_START=1 /DNA_END=619 /DNA_ORIENTATION=+
MRASHVVLMAFLLLYTMPWSGQRVAAYESWSSTSRHSGQSVAWLLALGESCLNLDNVAFSLGIASCFREVDPQRRTAYVANEVVVLVGVVITLICFEVSLISSASRDVKEQSMQGQRSAVTSLLNMMCDAVVELDDELRMVGDCKALSNSLFHHQGKGLMGQLLQQFVVADDQLFFEGEMVSQDKASVDAANMFHVRLRDSWGTAV